MRYGLVFLAACWRGPVPESRDTPADAPPLVVHAPRPTPTPTPSPIASPAPANTTCPSGQGINARVIALQVIANGHRIEVTVGAGAMQGVAPNWVASFAQTPATIIRIDAQRTVLQMGLLPQQVQASPFVLICAP